MIKNFRNKGLQRLYERADPKGLSAETVPKIERIIARLDIATAPNMMALPSLKLHSLKGELQGFWSVYGTGNWRIIFRFEGTDVVDVDLIDYH